MPDKKHITIILFLLLVSFLNACDKTDHNQKKGDVFLVKLSDKSFTTWKISEIEKKTFWYICNDYTVSERYLIKSIDLPNNYTDSPKFIDKAQFYKNQELQLIKNLKNEE